MTDNELLLTLMSKVNAMRMAIEFQRSESPPKDWKSGYVWLLRSSLEALGEENTPQAAVRAYATPGRGEEK